jgi:site-specific DNA-methyltransferase (adenine-specific)
VYLQDARTMKAVSSNSVALVVTSPPYFAGKEYEVALGQEGVPADYLSYLELLCDVFSECKRVLEPGGRIAVNVANLGRRPYRSLSSDLIQILQDKLGLLLRGEIVWWKGRAAGGSCAWGSFQSPANPVLRDVTERVVVASKGRFDRARSRVARHAQGLPSTVTISRDEFLEATTDLWDIPAESATRVGHPAPFPVELPKRLIELYTYEGDLVLDPFMGSGSTAVAALRTQRHYLGYETEETYWRKANERLVRETLNLEDQREDFRVRLPVVVLAQEDEDCHGRAVREGRQATRIASMLLEECGFQEIRENVKLHDLGIELDFCAKDRTGGDWAFDVSGAFTSGRTGLKRTDTLLKVLGKATVLQAGRAHIPLVLMTTDAPTPASASAAVLKVVKNSTSAIFDLVELLSAPDRQRLRDYARNGRPNR